MCTNNNKYENNEDDKNKDDKNKDDKNKDDKNKDDKNKDDKNKDDKNKDEKNKDDKNKDDDEIKNVDNNKNNNENKFNDDNIKNIINKTKEILASKKRFSLFGEFSNEEDDNQPILKIKKIDNSRNKCQNINCDHRKYYSNWYDTNKIIIPQINSLDDLVTLGRYYHCKMRRYYNGIDLKMLNSTEEHLIELKEMIGLNNIKEEIINLIIYLLINKGLKTQELDLLNVVVTGVPGTGKTTFIEILAKILTSLGVLKFGQIVKVRRADLIGKYLGHTAIQTQKKIDEAYGGILLIDEAYALGNPEGKDSFSKECLDTLNQALSEDKGKFICIIAGYKDALDSSFFKYNEGLKRRFPFRFEIEKYAYNELSSILIKKIKLNNNWELLCEENEIIKLIKENYENFENQGGDMETVFLNIRIVQNKRVFLLPVSEKKKIIYEDLDLAIKKFNILRCIKKPELCPSLYGMYL
jgi:hypothetical protein